jgi:error-prone DNA polymerase
MSDPFVHLHVASGYSLRYGASSPATLVARAADLGMTDLALTDRDGVYGAVKFVQACAAAGIRPLLGVDLAVAPAATEPLAARGSVGCGATVPGRRTPARGGVSVDPRLPRVTLLAADRRGWAALCRLVSATHLAGARGRPVTTVELVATHAAGGRLLVLLGPHSEVGEACAAHRPDRARALLRPWRAAVAAENLLVEVVSHGGPGDAARGARLAGFAAEERLSAVLTNAVRYAERGDAPTADVLDAARRLVPLDRRHVDRVTAEGYLKSGKEMAEVATEIARLAGTGSRGARTLLSRTRVVAERCALDPTADLGIGVTHFPELTVTSPDAAVAGRAADAVLRERCVAGFGRRGLPPTREGDTRLDAELDVIARLGYAAYFLTVADVVDLIHAAGVRCAARGSGAGSLVTFLLGISDVDPLRYGLVFERFLSPLRAALPDIDIDVESARRTEVYESILARYGGERCTCVSMMDTYRVRHAIRDVGAALGLPPPEVDALAKAFPHIRAGQARAALRELPELRASGIDPQRMDLLFRLVERLDGLPRHIALHPCGVLLSDRTLLDRTPVEASWLGFPMSQFDKDDVEALGLLKLDVLGVRMQSAMAHAVAEVRRIDGVTVDIDRVPRDDPATFTLVRSTRTLGCFQIESPGQRELIGKFAPETFEDLIVDISLFRPGPVKTDMVTPFLEARQGWREPRSLHPDLEPVLRETCGVVVFHEQVLRIVATLTGCSLAEADEVRRALGDPETQPDVRAWFCPAAVAHGYPSAVVEQAWEVLRGFASFGFCKAHAAAFAVPTYQSAWLKAHHPAAFLAGVLTHDPGMYPKRLILADARQFGVAVLPLDVNRSDAVYRVERLAVPDARLEEPTTPDPGGCEGHTYGIRLSLAEIKGITEGEATRIVAARPFASLSDFWHRTAVSRPIVERLVVAGGFDAVYGIGAALPIRRRGQLTRRDLLLQVAELDAWTRAGRRGGGSRSPVRGRPPVPDRAAADDVCARAARQSPAAIARPAGPVQLALDLGGPGEAVPSGLPDMSDPERVRAELEVLGLDATRHVVDFYAPFLAALGVTRARDLVQCRTHADVLVAGVKVATQTPPVRSGRRVVFVTLDDATGPVDATVFEDAQVVTAATLFHAWLLVIRGHVRRTGSRGVSIRATGCWELSALAAAWAEGGLPAVLTAMTAARPVTDAAVQGAAESRSTRPVMVSPSLATGSPATGSPATGSPATGSPATGSAATGSAAIGSAAAGGRPSPYTDVGPAGGVAAAPRRLWHASPGSAG